MKVEIHHRNSRLSKSLREFVLARIEFALDRFQDRIKEVQIRLRDFNGPRGGLGKECLLQLHLRDGLDVVITSRAQIFELAIAKSVNRSAGTLGRRLARKRAKRKDQLSLFTAEVA